MKEGTKVDRFPLFFGEVCPQAPQSPSAFDIVDRVRVGGSKFEGGKWPSLPQPLPNSDAFFLLPKDVWLLTSSLPSPMPNPPGCFCFSGRDVSVVS